LVAVLKINGDLERIGDMAVNIAETVSFFKNHQQEGRREFDFRNMAEKVRSLLRRSLDSLVNLDEDLALNVCASDDEIDELHRGMYALVEEQIQKNPDQVGRYLRYLLISRNLERVADHSTNIAEDVLYMAKGRIHRHIHETETKMK
jgi:phosphate transport system protein